MRCVLYEQVLQVYDLSARVPTMQELLCNYLRNVTLQVLLTVSFVRTNNMSNRLIARRLIIYSFTQNRHACIHMI